MQAALATIVGAVVANTLCYSIVLRFWKLENMEFCMEQNSQKNVPNAKNTN